jgi:protein gp37
MSENSKIEWCDHTFNPWEGCQHAGPGCDNCYAEKRNARFGGGQAPNWGPGAPRRLTSEANWRKPKKWQKQAAAFKALHGRRQRVFCASLADVFDNQVPAEWRLDLFKLIAATPDLDWLLLTKRIGNANSMMDEVARAQPIPGRRTDPDPLSWQPMDNVWLGATITSQAEADRDIPKLLAVPARVRFLSMEPLLGPVSVEGLFANPNDIRDGTNALEDLDWVIVGGESGPGARPMHPDWARSLRDQCASVGVPFLFKQWGEWEPIDSWHMWDSRKQWALRLDGSDVPLNEWHDDAARLKRTGKAAAGRRLDGIEHNAFPGEAA